MRFFIILFFLFFNSVAYAGKGNPDILKDEKASAWLKTQKWSQHIIDEWIRNNDLPNSLTEGFDNSVCHVYAAKYNLIAGLEGVGEFPENHEEIIPVEWEFFLENEHATGRIAKFDMYNNGQPLIIEKFIYKDGKRADKYKLYNKKDFSLKDYKSLRKSNFKKLKSYRNDFDNEFAICIDGEEEQCNRKSPEEYSKYRIYSYPFNPNFFTYNGQPYIGVKYYENIFGIKDILYRYDNGRKKRACVYSGYKTNTKKQIDDLKKRFYLANENMKNSLAENNAFYLRAKGSGEWVKKECSIAKDIGKDFFDLVNSRLEPEDRCPEDLSVLVRKVLKLTKKEKNGMILYLDKNEVLGTLWDNNRIIDTNGNIIGYKKGNKILDFNEDVIGIIEED